MKLYLVKTNNVTIDVYASRKDANRRVTVENRIYKDSIKLNNQLASLKVYIETSKNCPVKKKEPTLKVNRDYKIFYDLSTFIEVMEYKECVKLTLYNYCKLFNKEQRKLYYRLSIEEKELK